MILLTEQERSLMNAAAAKSEKMISDTQRRVRDDVVEYLQGQISEQFPFDDPVFLYLLREFPQTWMPTESQIGIWNEFKEAQS